MKLPRASIVTGAAAGIGRATAHALIAASVPLAGLGVEGGASRLLDQSIFACRRT